MPQPPSWRHHRMEQMSPLCTSYLRTRACDTGRLSHLSINCIPQYMIAYTQLRAQCTRVYTSGPHVRAQIGYGMRVKLVIVNSARVCGRRRSVPCRGTHAGSGRVFVSTTLTRSDRSSDMVTLNDGTIGNATLMPSNHNENSRNPRATRTHTHH